MACLFRIRQALSKEVDYYFRQTRDELNILEERRFAPSTQCEMPETRLSKHPVRVNSKVLLLRNTCALLLTKSESKRLEAPISRARAQDLVITSSKEQVLVASLNENTTALILLGPTMRGEGSEIYISLRTNWSNEGSDLTS